MGTRRAIHAQLRTLPPYPLHDHPVHGTNDAPWTGTTSPGAPTSADTWRHRRPPCWCLLGEVEVDGGNGATRAGPWTGRSRWTLKRTADEGASASPMHCSETMWSAFVTVDAMKPTYHKYIASLRRYEWRRCLQDACYGECRPRRAEPRPDRAEQSATHVIKTKLTSIHGSTLQAMDTKDEKEEEGKLGRTPPSPPRLLSSPDRALVGTSATRQKKERNHARAPSPAHRIARLAAGPTNARCRAALT